MSSTSWKRFVLWVWWRKGKILLGFLFILFFIGFFIPFLYIYAGPLVRVIDGDTVVWRNEQGHLEKIRFLAMDAPETTQICQDAHGFPWECGKEAAKRLKEMIDTEGNSGKSFKCKRDSQRDGRGRTLAVCYIQNTRIPGSRVVDIGRQMVKEGWAVPYAAMSHLYEEEEIFAKDHHLGMWSGTFDRPELWRVKMKTGKLYQSIFDTQISQEKDS